jgi:diphosphomevalonate decarboxylase
MMQSLVALTNRRKFSSTLASTFFIRHRLEANGHTVMERTAVSHPNKALTIYWGNENDELRIPTRSSLSITLQGVNRPLNYTITLRTGESLSNDKVFIDGIENMGEIRSHFVRHLDIMREYTGFRGKVEVLARKSFPVGSGLAGSAASASALAEAFAGLIEKNTDRRLVSIMARRGSGSAARSVFGGFVMWRKGDGNATSYAEQLFNENHWDIRNVIAIVSSAPKKVSSIDGMRISKQTCPEKIYSTFASIADLHIEEMKSAIAARDIEKLGVFYETENDLFRKVCIQSVPSLDYWMKITHNIFDKVAALRKEGIPAYAGTDAGPNVHILTLPNYVEKVFATFRGMEGVQELVHCKVGEGSHLI